MRVLIISDVHGNIDALKKICETERYDAVWFLGDLTDYGPNPDEVLDYLRSLKPEVWVTGNHDYANAYDVDCGCGEKTHKLSVYTRKNITKKLLSAEDIAFLKSLPLNKTMEMDGKKYYFVHGCPSNPLYGYMFRFDPECMKDEKGMPLSIEFLLYGHTHFPVIGEFESVKYLNPGSTGQPRDGDWRASYAILEDGKIHLRRIEYPVEKTIQKLKQIVKNKDMMAMLESLLRNGNI